MSCWKREKEEHEKRLSELRGEQCLTQALLQIHTHTHTHTHTHVLTHSKRLHTFIPCQPPAGGTASTEGTQQETDGAVADGSSGRPEQDEERPRETQPLTPVELELKRELERQNLMQGCVV